MKFGLVINPYAGMGGSVGLKGTDGASKDEAIARGAIPKARSRAKEALISAGDLSGIHFLAAGGEMGGSLLEEMGLTYEIIYHPGKVTQGKDTTEVVRLFCQMGCDLIIFCGGDGTARDVMEGVDGPITCVGIPAGVKMHSGVFANHPHDAGLLISSFIKGNRRTVEAEVMDIDEDMFREGVLTAKLVGYLRVIDDINLVQLPKGTMEVQGEEEEKQEIASYIVDKMVPDALYVLGPGTTVEAVGKVLGIDKTLLGVDLVKNRRMVHKDASEKDILSHMVSEKDVWIVVTPIGRQGFIFGRGNQQISPQVIRRAGIDHIIIAATRNKLNGLKTLRADTGDGSLDYDLSGFRRVLVGYGYERLVKLE
ncbi:MAG: ATP-NAD kinase family protein [Methanomassiliicoccales archaeon]|nr:MAG: ATP-NAD kinase family protein [Methanomassiliicoccales archaeon]